MPRHKPSLYELENTPKAERFCVQILPHVSRTFAMNIQVLQGSIYWSILVAYLICRILDTIEDADTPILQKKRLLRQFPRFMEDPETFPFEGLNRWIQDALTLQKITPWEALLLKRSKDVLAVYHKRPPSHKRCLFHPIKEMADGMAHTLETYQSQLVSHGHVQFKTQNELKQYCYYVAGTVGNLITNLFKLKIKSVMKHRVLDRHKNDFALALQTTNIARDSFRDLGRGWCYIPMNWEKTNSKNIPKENILAFLQDIKTYFTSSITYIKTLPRWQVSHRLFCLLPFFFGVRTVYHLEAFCRHAYDEDVKMPPSPSLLKISRFEVRMIQILSLGAAVSNRFMDVLYHRLQRQKKGL